MALTAAAAVVAAAAALAPSYAGRTDEGRRIVIEAERGRVVLVHAAVVAYECDVFGDVGPLRVHARVSARVDSRGRFAVESGDRAETVILRGTLTARRATGTLRVSGTIATGRRCESQTVRFTARPR